MFARKQRIAVKTPAQVDRMRAAGLVVADALAAMRAAVRPGLTTGDLDGVAAEVLRAAGATPSFLGYHGFPAVICASVNDEIVHGIPGDRVIRQGDLVSLDCGAIVDGWHADAAITVGCGDIEPADADLMIATENALWAGLAATRAGHHLSDIGHAIESSAQQSGAYGLVREYTGHGIGREMHEDPNVPNFGPPGRGPGLRVGVVVAVEPMLTRGSRQTRQLADGWTVVTADGTRSAHFEHTVAITANGPWVLTAHDGGAARLGRAPAS